jgi:glutathione peroxidase
MAMDAIYGKTPVGEIEIKTIPPAKALVATAGGSPFQNQDNAFRKLSRYLQEHRLGMTAPVETETDHNRMRFYIRPADAGQKLPPDSSVSVVDLPARTVVSVGLRGAYSEKLYRKGLTRLKDWLTAHPRQIQTGPPCVVYWESTFMPGFLKRSEVHIPVRAVEPRPAQSWERDHRQNNSVYEFTMKDIDGRLVSLSAYQGKVALIVNVASRCAYTPQYQELERLYERYKDRGFVILGFPANNFLRQEPGSDQEIKDFCSRRYQVTFPMFSKISVKGEDISPLYQFLTEEATDPEFAGEITWNFNKFLIDRNGKVIGRFGTHVKPESKKVLRAIEQALNE